MAMNPAQLKENFERQIADTDKQIAELEKNLDKAKEYKLKLIGGLETIGLLAGEEEPAEETPAE
jgi:ferritin-like metal-binding protein YciE